MIIKFIATNDSFIDYNLVNEIKKRSSTRYLSGQSPASTHACRLRQLCQPELRHNPFHKGVFVAVIIPTLSMYICNTNAKHALKNIFWEINFRKFLKVSKITKLCCEIKLLIPQACLYPIQFVLSCQERGAVVVDANNGGNSEGREKLMSALV